MLNVIQENMEICYPQKTFVTIRDVKFKIISVHKKNTKDVDEKLQI